MSKMQRDRRKLGSLLQTPRGDARPTLLLLVVKNCHLQPLRVLLSVFLLAGWLSQVAIVQAEEKPASKKDPVPSSPPALSQQEKAQMAMQKSLGRQQAALDGFVTRSSTPASLERQQSAILKQVTKAQGLQLDGASPEPGSEVASDASPHTAPTRKSFFTLPWPSAIPLAVPNVQMVDDSCEAMPRSDVDRLIQSSASQEGVDATLLRSVMRQESAFKPCAVSVAGAMGLMQIMPGTAEMLGLDDPFDPAKNTAAGAKYLRQMLDRYQGDIPMALGAYNAGPGRVDKASGVPPIAETLQYVTNIIRSLPIN
jgi:hypothetical protein